jgi:hypothetical protein
MNLQEFRQLFPFGFFLSILLLLSVRGADRQPAKKYRAKEFEFSCPAAFKVSTKSNGAFTYIAAPSQSTYWQDAITIRQLNKKTEECDLPQSTTPEAGPKRKIAGRVAYGYFEEDAAMNRYVKTKGYMIERAGLCWDFQLVRTGKPYRKFDLPEKELKRLDDQAERDAKAAQTAFNTVLDSFGFVRAK